MATRQIPITGIPCPTCTATVGEWCIDSGGGVYGPLHHSGRVSLALVIGSHPSDVDPVGMIRDASGSPDDPLWECVARIERRHPGGVRRWLGSVGLVDNRTGLPVWYPSGVDR